MKLVESKLGEYRLLIESKDGTIVSSIQNERETVKTGMIKDKLYDEIIKDAKGIIKCIANEFGNELMSVQPQPSEFEFEFGLSLSTEMTAWILTANGNSNLKVTMKWVKSE